MPIRRHELPMRRPEPPGGECASVFAGVVLVLLAAVLNIVWFAVLAAAVVLAARWAWSWGN